MGGLQDAPFMKSHARLQPGLHSSGGMSSQDPCQQTTLILKNFSTLF